MQFNGWGQMHGNVQLGCGVYAYVLYNIGFVLYNTLDIQTGETALYLASGEGNIELVKLLLRNGARVNLKVFTAL